jgi:hypothetical protein
MTPIDLQPFVLWPDVVLKQKTTFSFFRFFSLFPFYSLTTAIGHEDL